jgi:hypothetical protein
MKSWFAYCLVLLLASAPLDGAWAAATPDPCDDALAAQSDAYLPSSPQSGHKALQDGGGSLPGGPLVPDTAPPRAFAAPWLEARAHAPAGLPLYSLLMTLRC